MEQLQILHLRSNNMEQVIELLFKGFCIILLLAGLTLFLFMNVESMELFAALHTNLSNPIVVKESEENNLQDIIIKGYHIYYSLQEERDYDLYIDGINRGKENYLIEDIQVMDIELDSEYTSNILYEDGNIRRIQYRQMNK